jgi:voltage-gated sodium channel
MFTLFQVMTLESWSMGIARPVMQTHPWAWAFFIPFILVSTFTVLNLFIAIMVDAMQSIEEQQLARTEAHLNTARRADQQQLHADLAALSEQMAQMQQRLQRLQDQLQPPNSTEA